MKPLVGQGKPFHSSLDKAAGLLKRKVGTGAEFMKELMGIPGIKQTEIQERGLGEVLGMPRMTHDQFMAALGSKPAPVIGEKVLGGDPDDPNWIGPYHYQWSLPGGENYREMLIKLPDERSGMDEKRFELDAQLRRAAPEKRSAIMRQMDELRNKYEKTPEVFGGVGIHFGGEPGILASMRLKDRTGPNGEKLLHLEELQSDWHQQGREKGYKEPGLDEKFKAMVAQYDQLDEQRRNLLKAARNTPDAQMDVFTKMMDQAREMSIQLTDLHEKMDEARSAIDGVPDAPFKKNWEEMALKRLIHHAAEKGYHGVVVTRGQEQADRYPRQDESEKIAQEKGMKSFYDSKVPNILNSIGKKYGVKTQVGGHRLQGSPEDYGNAVEQLGIAHIPMAQLTPEQNQKIAETADKRLHHFPITEDMRKDVLTNGLPLYAQGGIIHKAEGGNVQPSLTQMKMEIANKANPINMKNIGVNEAPGMFPKAFFPPDKQLSGMPSPGGVATPNGMPVGGVDTSQQQPGQQLMPQPMTPPPPQGGLPGQPPAPGGAPGAPDMAPQGPTPPMGNMLQMTPQGQALGAMKGPQAMAKGGSAKSVDEMKAEMAAKAPKDTGKRVTIQAEGSGGVKGIVVPRHTLEGNKNAGAVGMHEMNEARAKVYGADHRDPLTLSKMASMHKKTLADHFAKPIDEQHEAEEAALGRLREAKHIGKTANTLDESEKLDTVRHEEDDQGRTHIGFASKGVAGHALYTTGHGKGTKYNVVNTCPGQTEGCGGGKDANGVVDTKKGTCFAPNAESQYAGAAVRRAAHAQAKHDPAMTNDWILAHTGSLRNAARLADKNNKRLLFRPNVVDETDVTSRHAIRHLNDQRKADGKPPIIANSYGKTNELHDPENGYYVTHSNVGPKVKKGESIAENIGRDKARVRNTIMAADNKGDFKNEQGNKTPPKGSYMVTDVRRGSDMSKKMEKSITHAKYWTTGREEHELTADEKDEGPEGHFGGNGKPTTPDKAHFGHTTVKGKRFDYQKQHILHPRLVQVGENKDGTPHMIPTDSRFKDEEFLPKNRFKTKNGKDAGHILMTTPTESTSLVGHQTSFTHNVNDKHIEHAMKNKGEYEIDKPEDQIKAEGKEYRAPQSMKFYAEGGSVDGRHHGFSHDDFHAFPEQNVVAQRHLAMRHGEDETKHTRFKMPVAVHKNTGTMQLEMILKKKAK